MPEKKPDQELRELRDALDNLSSDDPATRDRLQQHIDDIEKKLADPADEAHHDNMMSGLKDSIAQFETEHPRATAILNDIMVTLSNMGI